MNLTAKIKKLEREIESLWLACGGRREPDKAASTLAALNTYVATFGGHEVELRRDLEQPKRRGRPPKVTNGN